MDNQLLTVKEVAKQLQISRPFLHRLTKSGQIKHVRVGSRIRYTDSAIKDFINSQLQEVQEQD